MRANKSKSAHRYALRQVASLAILSILCFYASARAELGGSVSSIQVDQESMKGSVRVMPARSFTIHEIQMPTGTVVREFVSPAGTVFGVAWEGPWMPDLRQLLGSYFDQFAQAAQTSKRRGRGPLFIQENGLVVQTGGHARSFFGRAYLVPMLPPNVSAEEIK